MTKQFTQFSERARALVKLLAQSKGVDIELRIEVLRDLADQAERTADDLAYDGDAEEPQ